MYTCINLKRIKLFTPIELTILRKESYIQFHTNTHRRITLNMWAYEIFYRKI